MELSFPSFSLRSRYFLFFFAVCFGSLSCWKINTSVASVDELFQFVQEEWEKIPDETLSNLVKSMPNRIKEVIKNKGGSTHY